MGEARWVVDGVKFAVRVGIIAVDPVTDRVLVNTVDGMGHYFLPGGAADLMEDSLSAAAREWREETGTKPGELRFAGVIENFWHGRGYEQHEIGLFLRMLDLPADLPRTSFTVADSPETRFEWLPLAHLTDQVLPLSVVPLILETAEQIVHRVQRAGRSHGPFPSSTM